MASKPKTNGNGKKFRVQSLALFIALAAPFGIFVAMRGGQLLLAALFFALLALAMALTIWKG